MRAPAPIFPTDAAAGFAWFDLLREWLSRCPLSLIQLAGRIGVGATSFKARLLKYHSWDFTVLLFRDEYKVALLDPACAARIAKVRQLPIPLVLFLVLPTLLATPRLRGLILRIQS